MSNSQLNRPNKFAKALIALALTLLVTSCANSGGVPDLAVSKKDTFCQTSKPILLNDAAIAALDEKGVKDTLAHNRFGAKHCGWKPGARTQ